MNGDIEVRCTMCGFTEFEMIKMLKSSKMSAFLNTEYADSYLYGYVCKNCKHIEWFAEDVLGDRAE